MEGRPFLFAWFTATNQATGAASEGEEIAVSKSVKTIGLKFDFVITVAPVKSSNGAYQGNSGQDNYNPMNGNMELVTVMDETAASAAGNGAAAGKNFGYIDPSGTTRYQQTQISNPALDYWRIYSVSVAIKHDEGQTYQTATDGQKYDDSQIWSALAEKEFVLSVAGADGNSIAKFYAVTANNLASKAEIEQGGTKNYITSASGTKFSEANLTTPTFYFGMYVDGADHNEAKKDENLQDGDFTVTLETEA